jgi:rSAM/selenodomain-associated transferase 1
MLYLEGQAVTMKKTAIIIFIKNPDLGRVKKRLAKTVGDETALKVYKEMLDHAKMITRSLSTDKYLFYDRITDINDSWPNDIYQKEVQSGKDMATRIHNAFKAVFDKGYEHVVIIGSDCLELDERIIRLAFRQLDHFDTVLGPTRDGVFYLLGMNEFYPGIFNVKGWGTPVLSTQVVKSINNLHKTCFMLSELSGIVTADDLNVNFKSLIK